MEQISPSFCKEDWLKTRGEVGGGNGGRGEGFSGTCIKDTWTKPQEGRIKSGK